MGMPSLYKRVLLAAFVCNILNTVLAADSSTPPSRGKTQSGVTSVTNKIFNKPVIFDIPAGWKPAQQSANQTQHVIEFIPQQQTLKAWKELITLLTFRDMARDPKVTPIALLALVAAGIQKACGDQFVSQSLGDRKVDSLDAHAAIIGCAKLPVGAAGAKEGQSEIGLYVAVKGNSDAYVFQRAIRGAVFDKNNPPLSVANIDDSFLSLHSVKLCGGSIPMVQCSFRDTR